MLQFKKHYTRDEARQLLPQVRAWLDELSNLRGRLQAQDSELALALGAGEDQGGGLVNSYARNLSAVKQVLLQFQNHDIQIKDLDRGLVDFPAFIGGNEVFLCWEKGEDDIEFWHDLDSGYAGREPL